MEDGRLDVKAFRRHLLVQEDVAEEDSAWGSASGVFPTCLQAQKVTQKESEGG